MWLDSVMDRKRILNVRFLAEAGIVAALYFVLTIAVAPISYGQIQIRISEALCVLPFFMPAAIPGLFIGCLLANIFSSLGLFDVVFGSLATLAAATITYLIGRSKSKKAYHKWLAPLPSVVINAFVVGALLYFVLDFPFFLSVALVGAGQAIACYVLGMPLLFILDKYKLKLFNRT